jgi:5'-nucleotidase
MYLTVLHTNDLHGHVEALARISTMAGVIRRQAAAEGRAALLWDAGDAEDRTFPESDVTKGAAVMALLNAAGYDLAALGNAVVLSYGPQVAEALTQAATFPILACNLFYPNPNVLVAGPQASALFNIDGLRLGVVGLTATLELYRIYGAVTPDPIPLVAREVESLRARGARFIALLSHLGTRDDVRLAEAVRGIDLIVAGHDHRALEQPLVVGETWIVSTGAYGRYLGQVDMEIDTDSGQVLARQARLLPVTDDVPPDPAVRAALEGERARVQALMATPVSRLAQNLDLAADRECGMGDLMADVLRERVGADMAISAPGAMSEGLKAGQVTLGDLCRACSSPGNPARALLTGAEIMALLERGLDPEVWRARPKALRGQQMGIPQVSGLSYRWRPWAATGERLAGAWLAGEPLDPTRRYIVAASNLEFSRQFGYLSLADDKVTYEVPTVLREALQEHLACRPLVHIDVGGRIEVED